MCVCVCKLAKAFKNSWKIFQLKEMIRFYFIFLNFIVKKVKDGDEKYCNTNRNKRLIIWVKHPT